MATLLELADFIGSPDYNTLTKKIKAAIVKKAVAISKLASPTAPQIRWAKEALANPNATAAVIIHFIIGEHAALTITQIKNAGDAAIETNVGAAVDKVLSL